MLNNPGQKITEITDPLRDVYSVWELQPAKFMKMSAKLRELEWKIKTLDKSL